MKKRTLLYILPLFLTLTSCANRTSYICDDVVCQTFVHKYGHEVHPEDWTSRGEHGNVVTTLATGVVVNAGYTGGVLDGDSTYTFPHSEIIERVETYYKGALVRETKNNSLGHPIFETRYDAPGQRTVTTWFDNGSPHCIEKFQGGSLMSGEYFTPTNQVESTVENGSGNRFVRDPYGHLISKDTIANGDMIERTTFYPNGAPQAITSYRNGVIQGPKRIFTPTGEPASIEQWASNQQNGVTTIFQNGEKVAEVPYVNGMKDGLERRFKNENEVVEEITWKRDQRHGPSFTYVQGKVKGDWYFKDRIVSKPTYDQMSKG